jgi:hypothetical protein
MMKRVLVGAIVAGGLIAGGATAYADSGSSTPSPSTTAATANAAHTHKHKRHLFRGLRGVHGQVTVKNAKTGQYVTREWQRGTVTATSGNTLTVTSADGVHWSWTVDSKAVTTRNGAKIADSTLKDGDSVLVVGRVQGSANDAQRIFAPVKK